MFSAAYAGVSVMSGGFITGTGMHVFLCRHKPVLSLYDLLQLMQSNVKWELFWTKSLNFVEFIRFKCLSVSKCLLYFYCKNVFLIYIKKIENKLN